MGFQIAKIFVFYFVLGLVADSLGLSTQGSVNVPETPEGGNAFTGGLDVILGAIGAFFQLMTFQLEISPVINGILVGFVAIFTLYVVLRLIRGGG